MLQLRQQYYNRKIKQLRSSDPRKWWQSVKRFIGFDQIERSEVSNLATQLNYDEDCALAIDINKFFAGVASDLNPLWDDFCDQFVCDCDSCATVQNTQLNHGRSKSNCHESSCVGGPDNIPNWLLQEMSPFIAEPICAIFNVSIHQGRVSMTWKAANTVPVAKVHPPRDIPVSYTHLTLPTNREV